MMMYDTTPATVEKSLNRLPLKNRLQTELGFSVLLRVFISSYEVWKTAKYVLMPDVMSLFVPNG